MKWVSLLKDIKEKVGLSQTPAASPVSGSSSSPFSSNENVQSARQDFSGSPSRDKHELELDFKRFWEEFRSSSSEKEKEAALNLTVDVFCRLVKQHANVAQLVTMLVETHIFSFVVGRAFVTDIEKLKIGSKTRSLNVVKVLNFFSEVTKDGISPGSNLLNAVEVLVSGPIDKQSLLDSGIFCCLIHILNALLDPSDANQRQKTPDKEELSLANKDYDGDVAQVRQLGIEGSVVHIMKALASHPSAAQSLIEDDSLQLLFQMVANGSLTVFSQYKDGLIPLHTIQLHRHAMQILGLLLVNDNGSTAKYIHKHHLIKVLLMAVKGFNPDSGDSAYTVGIVDLLLECVELSYRPEAGGIKLREDIHNAHGYQFLVQFALLLSTMPNYQGIQGDNSPQNLSPTLSRLLDVLVNLAQTGPADSAGSAGSRGFKSSHTKAIGHGRSRTSSSDRIGDEIWEKDNYKVKDLEAVQMLQDIFLKANSRELQAEVLNRMFKIFSGHLENYKLCQQLRTVPLLILNMDGFPPSLQEIILKILEYAVTVVNCIPEQELLSLCCLLQQPITSELKHTILSFFVKLLSFDQQYKKVLREVGLERKSSSGGFKKHFDSKDAIISSPKLIESGSEKFPLFEIESTVAVAWDCLVSLLKKTETNQASFRSTSGVTTVLPFLVSDIHRSGVLRVFSCLIIEDVTQAHPEELGALVEVLKSGMVTSVSGSQYRLQNDAKCDILGSVWRILGVNSSAQRVFGEATGFSLLLTTLHSFQNNEGHTDQSSLVIYVKVFTYLLRVVTAGVFDNAANRTNETGSSTFVLATPSGSFNPDKERVYNAGAVRVLIRSLLLFTPKVQLEVLNIIDKLARAGPYNQENLTSVGCVELLLEIIHPFLLGLSPLLSYALKIVEVLGAYRLSTSELRVLIRYILQMRLKSSGHILVSMMERLILMEDLAFESVPLAPFVEMDMSRIGHASVQVSLGARSWPPAAGYSFVCWFQYRNFLTSLSKETDSSKAGPSKRQSTSGKQQHGGHVLRIFSVGPVENGNAFYAELYLQEDGVLTLATSNSSSLSFSGLELEEDRWHHLAVEVLTSGCICFMYILGRGYRGLFQDTDLLRFVPNQSCGGGSMAILDSLDAESPLASNVQRLDSASKLGNSKADGSGIVWDLERLGNLSLQLSGKKLIFAFDGTCTEALRASGALSMLNLVDPMSAAASPIGGIPRFGRLHGDVYVCGQCVIGDSIRPVGGMAVVLALVEASETRDMLHMALTLLACALHQNPQNVKDMQTCRGYHLLSLFLHRRMSLFDMQSLEIFFQIAACEASFSEPKKLENTHNISLPAATIPEASIEDLNFSKFRDEFSSVGFHGDMDDFSAHKDSFSHISELENTDIPVETSNCIVLANADMVEHVLLDWTLWVKASISVQIALLGFLEHLVSMHWYRNHNLTVLRRINLVQHLLVTLQRGDVEVPVLEKLVVLLGVILEDGFLASELEHVVRFVIMTFDPPEPTPRRQIIRETMGKHIIVRNMLLEMLIDLQVTIHSEELLEQWHKIVSSKLITYFLDEAVHPTSMRWVMTLLGVCLASSPTFALKFRTSGGYQGLARVLPSFYDSPDVYYILFCLMFGKPVYPRLPEVRMLDFHALMPSDGSYGELKFVELLESVIAMAKSTYDRLSMQSMLAHQTGNLSQVSAGLVAELVEGNSDMAGELQGEALMHKTYAARLMGGEASAPAAATSVLRFMVDLAKMCPPFSAICRRAEFLESCVDLYFSCVRAAHAVKMAKELSLRTEERNSNDCDDTCSSQNTFSSLPNEQEQSAKTSISVGSFPQGQVSTSSEDMSMPLNYIAGETSEVRITASQQESSKSMQEYVQAVQRLDGETVDQVSATSCSNEFSFSNNKGTPDPIHLTDSQSSASLLIPDSPILSEKSGSRIPLTPFSSSAIALSNFLGSASVNESKAHLVGTPSMESSASMISPKLLLEMDDSGYGGGPCSAAATAVLDFMAEVLSDFVTEQMKAAQVMETILETAPLYVDAESILVFQGLCLSRLMNFLERRLLRDDEEDEKKLDKSRWSSNLDALCTMIVDRVYMGAFPQPATVLKTLEFLLSMLQLANKDGRIEGAAPGKGLLSIARGSRQLDAYIQSIIKNTNRMILYCFLPSFLISIGEDDFLSRLGLQIEPKKKSSPNSSEEDAGIDICTVLQLLVAHRRIIFCPSNLDTELSRSLNCCLCINLIPLLCDQRRNAVNMAVDVVKYLLVHRRAALEDLLVSKLNQGQLLDVLHGGFDKLLTGSLSAFFEWLQTSLEERRKRELGRRSRDIAKLDLRHWEQVNERRCALELVREAMSTELRVVRQDKYGWVLHAESEWQTYLQQLVHERGIFPMRKTSLTEDPEWQLCPIEGPYRMRKKLERCKLKIDTIQNVLDGQFESVEIELSREKNENGFEASDTDSESYFPLLDSASSINEASLHSALEFGVKSSAISVPMSESIHGRSDTGSPRQSSSVKIEEGKGTEDKLDKELLDNGEYLIRPYLEPLEKIRFRYNCERVVGLDKHDGIFLIGELCLYVIENFYIDDTGCICEKECEDELSVIDQALGKVCSSGNLPHAWNMWKLSSVHEILKRDYQLRPVAIEIFSMDGCNDLLVFHKKEREEVFKNLVAMNLPRNSMLDTTISGSMKQESNEGSRLFKIMAKSFSKRWQNGEISNFQYLMHLNTLAGRGYSDLTQYPVFPWVLADYESENLDLSDPKTFRKLEKPMGCQTLEGEEEFKKRYESWDDPEVPKFHYGSHYSSAGIVLFYLLRLPPFSAENQKLQGGQFDHADRLFNSVRDTWLSAAGKGNTSDVKELIPEFFYMPEFLENRFNLDLGEKQSGEKVGDVVLPPWAKGSTREFIRKHREALESDFVSENLHHWIDLIFGYKQRGKAAEEAVNVFYHYTYEGSVDIDSVTDPSLKASILAQINHFGQTPKQLFLKPHVKRRSDRKFPPHPLKHNMHLVPHEIRKCSSSITQIVTFHDKVLVAGTNSLLKPITYTKYVSWGFPDRSLRFMSYDQDRLLSTHENLHGGNQIQCASASHDGQILVTGADDGLVSVWRINKDGPRNLRRLQLEKALCAHTAKITCLHVSQPYMLIVSASDDCTVILWDLSSLVFVRQLPQFPAPISAIYVNDLTGEIVTAAGVLLAVWSINGDGLAVINTSQLPSDSILSVTSCTFSDWLDTNWYVTGHQSGAVKVWKMVHCSDEGSSRSKSTNIS
ncbi:unnamed protein product, partial [Vitis vinifera]